MQHISEIIENILVEWAYRVHDGMPNPKNAQHIQQLRESMEELNLPNKVIYEVIQNLINEDEGGLSDEEKEKAKKMNLVHLGRGAYGKEGGEATHQSVDGKLVAKDDREEPEKETKPPMKIDKNPMDKGGDTEEEQKSTTEKITQNASDIFNDNVTGKGGGTTSLQEEIAGISRKMAIEHPDDTPEQHQERIAQHIKDNYGNTKYGSKDQTNLIKKSASGQQTMNKIRANKNMKFADNQPEGFPIQVTFTEGGTDAVRSELERKLEEAKKSGDTEAISHYETELEYFKKHATKETGVEGDGDTGIMYVDTDGRIRMIYISNKQGLKDPHANATVKSATEAIKSSAEPGTNVEALSEELDAAVKGGINANGDMVKSFRADIDVNKEELNNAPLNKIGTKLLTGRAEFVDKTTDSYVKAAAKNPQVKDYIKKNNLDKNNPEHIIEAAMAVTGTGESDGLGGSKKQAANKLVFKMLTASASIRGKMQKLIPPKSPEEAAEAVANLKQRGKPLMGGNLSAADCLSIYNNKALEKLEQNIQTRKDAMQTAHENMYNRVVELDVAHHQGQGLSSDDAIEKYNNEAGPHEQTYTKSFMKRMHWDRYIDGVDDNKKMIEIGDKAYSTKDFRDCLGELSDWDGKGDLKEHLQKNMRITPGTMKLSFVTKKGKTIELGDDTWRTAGDLSKIAGGLGKDMRECLGKK
mgnify:FL=1